MGDPYCQTLLSSHVAFNPPKIGPTIAVPVRQSVPIVTDSVSTLTLASNFPTPNFTSRVVSFVFPSSEKMPSWEELEAVLENETPWLLCPRKIRLYQTTQRPIKTHKLVTYFCHCGDHSKNCGDHSNQSNNRFQLLVRVPIILIPISSGKRKGACIPASNEYEIFRRVNPASGQVNEHVDAEEPMTWNENGGLSAYGKHYMKTNLVPGLTWSEMLGKMNDHFRHTISTSPNGFINAARKHFQWIKAKIDPPPPLAGRSVNDLMQFIVDNDIFLKTHGTVPFPDLPSAPALKDFQELFGFC